MEKSGTQRQKKTIWTKVANLDKTQGLKWQFTLFFFILESIIFCIILYIL
ncbi:hypothetical protein Hanom_Chr17g01575061 [Helianthus anomalus]